MSILYKKLVSEKFHSDSLHPMFVSKSRRPVGLFQASLSRIRMVRRSFQTSHWFCWPFQVSPWVSRPYSGPTLGRAHNREVGLFRPHFKKKENYYSNMRTQIRRVGRPFQVSPWVSRPCSGPTLGYSHLKQSNVNITLFLGLIIEKNLIK